MSFLPDNPHAVIVSLEGDDIRHWKSYNESDGLATMFALFGPVHPDRFMILPIMETYISKGTAQRGFEEFSAD